MADRSRPWDNAAPPSKNVTIIVKLTALLALLVFPPGLQAQPVRVTGTSVSLAPPDGFTAASRFPGFERADLQASIMVTELPGPVVEVTRGMNAAGLASRGMTLISSERQQVDGKSALLLHVSQVVQGTTFLKWMLAAGDAKRTVLVVGTFPQSAERELGDAIKAALLSTRWNAAAPEHHFEGLPFRVSSTPALKIAGRMSNLLMLSESGTLGPHGPDAALFLIGLSVAPVTISDLQAFSEARARQTEQLRDIRIVRGAATTIASISGYELIAEGTDIASGRAVTVYQIVLPDAGGYVLMQGLVATPRARLMIPEFRRVAETYRGAQRR